MTLLQGDFDVWLPKKVIYLVCVLPLPLTQTITNDITYMPTISKHTPQSWRLEVGLVKQLQAHMICRLVETETDMQSRIWFLTHTLSLIEIAGITCQIIFKLFAKSQGSCNFRSFVHFLDSSVWIFPLQLAYVYASRVGFFVSISLQSPSNGPR